MGSLSIKLLWWESKWRSFQPTGISFGLGFCLCPFQASVQIMRHLLSLSLSSILYRNIFTGLRIHHPSPSSIRFSFLIKSSIRFSVTQNVPLLYYWVLIGLHSIHLLTSIKSLSLSFHLYHSLLVFFILSSLSFFFLLFFIPLDHGGTQANKTIH